MTEQHNVDEVAHDLAEQAEILSGWAGEDLSEEDAKVLAELTAERNQRFHDNAKDLGNRVMDKVREADGDLQQRLENDDHNVR